MKAKSFKPSQSQRIKNEWKKAASGLSLKAWVRARIRAGEGTFRLTLSQLQDWSFNKRANCAAPLKRIGRTNGKKSGGGGEPKKASKREKN